MEWFLPRGRYRQDDEIMTLKRMLGILAGSAIAVLAASTFEADAAGSLIQGSPLGMLLMVGLGLVGFGMWGKGRIFRRKPKEFKKFFRRFK